MIDRTENYHRPLHRSVPLDMANIEDQEFAATVPISSLIALL